MAISLSFLVQISSCYATKLDVFFYSLNFILFYFFNKKVRGSFAAPDSSKKNNIMK